jgi:hypothetical protein
MELSLKKQKNYIVIPVYQIICLLLSYYFDKVPKQKWYKLPYSGLGMAPDNSRWTKTTFQKGKSAKLVATLQISWVQSPRFICPWGGRGSGGGCQNSHGGVKLVRLQLPVTRGSARSGHQPNSPPSLQKMGCNARPRRYRYLWKVVFMNWGNISVYATDEKYPQSTPRTSQFTYQNWTYSQDTWRLFS